jgi:hypothetical protein
MQQRITTNNPIKYRASDQWKATPFTWGEYAGLFISIDYNDTSYHLIKSHSNVVRKKV